MKYRIKICLIICVACCSVSRAQFKRLIPTSLHIVKEYCNCGMGQGSRYRIVYDGITNAGNTYCNYSYNPVFRAPDSLKIKILSDLLTLASDTGLCCKPVKRYGGTSVAAPHSQSYTLQIDALFTFNFIAFGVNTRKYAPYPVLYDTVTHEEINKDPQKLNEVILLYKAWFKKVSEKGFTNYTFPLLTTKYRWYGSTNQERFLTGLPNHPKADNLGVPYLN